MDRKARLIVLDRDGVLNRTIPNPAEPRSDSPLRVAEVSVFPWVPPVLRQLNDAGFALCIASNQPAAAKGKTTREELERVHARVIEEAQRDGAVILSSHICFHRAEDGCACRKPRTGLLADIFRQHPSFAIPQSWMVGDRATDVLAGATFGLRTALLAENGGQTGEELRVLESHEIKPSYYGIDVRDFSRFLLRGE